MKKTIKALFAFGTGNKTFFIDSTNNKAIENLYKTKGKEITDIKKYKYNERYVNYDEEGEING
jgi:hypothetical protein